MRRLIILALISSFIPAPKAQANPAVLAPAAFCAGTAGVGCVFIGVATIGGIVYYVWQRSDGKKTYVRKYEWTEEPGTFNNLEQHETSGTKDPRLAEKRCRVDSGGRKYLGKYRDASGVWICRFRG